MTSGKGGVGKTTSAASFAMGMAAKNPEKKICVVDFDIGLRNLDIHLGAERRVIFDIINLLQMECTAQQALIKDKRYPNLSMLAASQTKDKESLTIAGVEHGEQGKMHEHGTKGEATAIEVCSFQRAIASSFDTLLFVLL